MVQKRVVPAREAALKQAVARRRDANAKDGEQGAVKSEASAVAVLALRSQSSQSRACKVRRGKPIDVG